jgi:hypothetical protein
VNVFTGAACLACCCVSVWIPFLKKAVLNIWNRTVQIKFVWDSVLRVLNYYYFAICQGRSAQKIIAEVVQFLERTSFISSQSLCQLQSCYKHTNGRI